MQNMETKQAPKMIASASASETQKRKAPKFAQPTNLAALGGRVAVVLALALLLVNLFGYVCAVDMAVPSNSIADSSAIAQSSSQREMDALIEDLLSDPRLKKSKGTRQVKQTLRFGRRSDPWLAPTELELEQQRRQERQQLAEALLSNRRLFELAA